MLKAGTEIVGKSMESATIISFILSQVLDGILSQIIRVFEHLQIIIIPFMFNMKFPGNVEMLQK